MILELGPGRRIYRVDPDDPSSAEPTELWLGEDGEIYTLSAEMWSTPTPPAEDGLAVSADHLPASLTDNDAPK